MSETHIEFIPFKTSSSCKTKTLAKREDTLEKETNYPNPNRERKKDRSFGVDHKQNRTPEKRNDHKTKRRNNKKRLCWQNQWGE